VCLCVFVLCWVCVLGVPLYLGYYRRKKKVEITERNGWVDGFSLPRTLTLLLLYLLYLFIRFTIFHSFLLLFGIIHRNFNIHTT
jgi:hypothetical protein